MPDDEVELTVSRADGERSVAAGSNHGVVVTGDGAQITVFPQINTTVEANNVDDRRQNMISRVTEQALRQHATTFRLSAIFMSAGALILLSGGGVALIRHGASTGSTAALVTSLAGVLITTCGGAFAVHASRARKHLTAQIDRIREELWTDRTLQQTLAMIERVDDPLLKDRLRSLTAVRTLGLAPSAESLIDRMLPRPDEAIQVITPEPPNDRRS
jgi:hypothetical protein